VKLLSQPLVGAFLGLAIGVTLFVLSRSSFRRMTADDARHGYHMIALGLLARLVTATIVLWLYKTIAPEGFLLFGLFLAGSFVVLFTFDAVRYSGLLGKQDLLGGHH